MFKGGEIAVDTKCWNFHGHIALPLEEMLKRAILTEKQFDIKADNIESGDFVELVLFMLVKKCGFTKEVCDLIHATEKYIYFPASKIPQNIAQHLFSSFKELYL